MGFERLVIRAGQGPSPRLKSTVTCHIRLMLQGTRKELWNTMTTNTPFSFVVGVAQVVRGLDEAIQTFKVGEKSEVTATPDFAYGVKGFPAWGIPCNATLVFEVELLSIE